MAGEHAGHRQRMRERFLQQGLDGFAPHEVLELLLFYAIPQKNVNPLAHQLIDRFGSLHGVLDADPKELQKVDGVGEYVATYLALYAPVAKRLLQSRAGAKEIIKNRGDAIQHCIRLMSGLKQEHFYLVCLNGQMELLGDVLIARGSLTDAPAYPRAVAEAALRYNAHTVVLCHNHPGGSLFASGQDLMVTQVISNVLSQIEVVMADHVIVAGEAAISLVGEGLIEQEIVDNTVLTIVADSAGEMLSKNRQTNKRRKHESNEEA